MLIISEENKKLKGTKHKLPKDIFQLYCKIVEKYPQYINDKGYKKAKNIVMLKDHMVTMEWLKNMKHFFSVHNKGESDISFILAGGYKVKEWVDWKLETLTSMYNGSQSIKNPMKVRKDSSNLSGNRSEHSSTSLSMVKSLISDIMPKVESIQKKNIIITEEQFKNITKYLNKNIK